MAKNKGYTAEAITVLEGLEPVRKRPGMYIGTTGPDGLHHLITEIFDNSRDEAMGGFANDIEIVLLPKNRVRVVDNGRGVPVDIHKQSKVSALETIMTTLHAGGKFDDKSYKVSGGLHGVGASVVNALSIFCEVIVHRDAGIYYQEYKQGKRKAAVKKIGKSNLHGTIVAFEPDAEIFKEGIIFDFNRVVNHMRQQAYLVKGLRISVVDARAFPEPIDLADVFYFRELGLDLPSQSFYFEGGLMSLITFYNKIFKPIHKNIFYVEKSGEGAESVEVALQYVDDISSRILPFANNIYNSEGGTHLTGFKTALTRTLNNYAKKNNLIKNGEDNFTGDDVLEGLTAAISIKLREVQFEGQTKAKLGSMEAQSAVSAIFGDALAAFLEEKPDDARAIINKVTLALKARKAAKAAKDSVLRKGALEGMTLPGKLADCQSNDPAESELFVVEGDSAGGCFVDDTKVTLFDSREITFKELIKEQEAGKKNYCYTIDKNGNVATAPIENLRKTKKNAELVKITLDDKKEITCTPDHKFMLRDGNFREAIKLTPKDSLMPFRKKISEIGGRITIKGYEMVYDPVDNFWVFTHLLGDKYNLGLGLYEKKPNTHIHHKDFNKLNNNPSNLMRMTKEEHLLYHIKHLDKTIHRPDVKERIAKLHRTKEFREKIRQAMLRPEMRTMLSTRAKKQWENEEYKKFMAGKFLEFYETNAEYRKENNRRLNLAQKEYWGKAENRLKQSQKTRLYFENHPEQKVFLNNFAIKQWADSQLREWRREETKKQWTENFRAKRKKAYNKTYLDKALKVFHDTFIESKKVDYERYEKIRRETNNKNLIRWQTIVDRFFDGEPKKFEEAVVNFNHRIKKVVRLKERSDVYDLEVKGTHNFALAAGVFVHNSAKTGRDRRIQAILPLRGKILNIERARLDKMLASEQIKNLVVALGTAIGDTFDLSRLRYHKVIIATDADVDGAHIRTLLLTLLYRHFRPLIDGGFIYIAQPPLYKIKKGKEIFYAYSDDEKNKIIGKSAESEFSIQRYKGLGEMNAEELWETTMDPARRVLKKVTVEDAQEADKVFEILMGEDVSARKSFIQSNAKLANLDI